MKNLSILKALRFCFIYVSSKSVDLKLSERNKEEDRIATGKGLIIFGTILSTGSALFLNKTYNIGGPKLD